MLFKFFRFYEKWMNKRPLLTKMYTAGILAGAGDILCQNIEKSNKTQNQ
jgi:hypothetical protein